MTNSYTFFRRLPALWTVPLICIIAASIRQAQAQDPAPVPPVILPPSPAPGMPEASCDTSGSRLVENMRNWIGRSRVCVSYDRAAFWKALSDMYGEKVDVNVLAKYLVYHDGVVKPLRTGYELDFYRKIKRLAAERKQGKKVGPEDILEAGLEACGGSEGPVNFELMLLTIHNVLRLMARPMVWADQLDQSRMDAGWYGHGPSDRAYPIMRDLLGIQSSDEGPSLPEIMGVERYPADFIPKVVANPLADDSSALNPARPGEVKNRYWSLTTLFNPDPAMGLFSPLPKAINSMWNGGSHYYFWLGTLARSIGGALGILGATWKEMEIKRSQDIERHGTVQMIQFLCGNGLGREAGKWFKENPQQCPPQDEVAQTWKLTKIQVNSEFSETQAEIKGWKSSVHFTLSEEPPALLRTNDSFNLTIKAEAKADDSDPFPYLYRLIPSWSLMALYDKKNPDHIDSYHLIRRNYLEPVQELTVGRNDKDFIPSDSKTYKFTVSPLTKDDLPNLTLVLSISPTYENMQGLIVPHPVKWVNYYYTKVSSDEKASQDNQNDH